MMNIADIPITMINLHVFSICKGSLSNLVWWSLHHDGSFVECDALVIIEFTDFIGWNTFWSKQVLVAVEV